MAKTAVPLRERRFRRQFASQISATRHGPRQRSGQDATPGFINEIAEYCSFDKTDYGTPELSNQVWSDG